MPKPTHKLAVLVAGVMLAGCATVKIQRVGPGPQPEGLPFYLPRPYVSVYEPFVIATKAYLVEGELSADGKHILLTNVVGDLDGHLKLKLGTAIPASMVVPLGTAPAAPSKGGPEAGGTAAAPAPGAAAPSPAKTPADTAAPTPAQPGVSAMKVTSDATAFFVTPNRRYFDVLWLPDFDEKYVIQSKPRLGGASVQVSLAQGWALQGLNTSVDNSAITKPLLDLYGTSLGLIGDLAKAKLAPITAILGKPQASVTPDKSALSFGGGAPITLKVTIVQVVAPGLYPVLKPSEFKAGLPSTVDGMYVPVPPYTNIAFKTYEAIVVEAAKPDGDTPMNFQRYYDADPAGGAQAAPAKPDAGTPYTSTTGDQMKARINPSLKNTKGSDGAYWEATAVTQTGDQVKVTVHLVGGKKAPATLPTPESLASPIASWLGGDLKAANILVTQ
jgi:hypothetical protein